MLSLLEDGAEEAVRADGDVEVVVVEVGVDYRGSVERV